METTVQRIFALANVLWSQTNTQIESYLAYSLYLETLLGFKTIYVNELIQLKTQGFYYIPASALYQIFGLQFPSAPRQHSSLYNCDCEDIVCKIMGAICCILLKES